MERPNGFTIWEGRSREDGAPTACVLTGFVRQSANPKTGDMKQSFIFRTDMSPDVAVKTGQDVSVCNRCELRQFLVKKKSEEEGAPKGSKPPMCYVTTHFSVRAVWEAWRRGAYPAVYPEQLPTLLRGHLVRLGAYGNFSNAPRWVVEKVAAASAGWTLYDHNWARPHAAWLKRFAMASVSDEAGKAAANAAGWRTFRVKRPGEPKLPDEVVCPASEEAGKKKTCAECLLCCGLARRAKNVVIDDHGPTSQGLSGRRHAARWALPTIDETKKGCGKCG